VRLGVAGLTNQKPAATHKQRAGILEAKAGTTVAKVIEFYIPNNFRKTVKWIPSEQRGKIIEFPSQIKKSA
jgi:hypothetical protein